MDNLMIIHFSSKPSCKIFDWLEVVENSFSNLYPSSLSSTHTTGKVMEPSNIVADSGGLGVKKVENHWFYCKTYNLTENS